LGTRTKVHKKNVGRRTKKRSPEEIQAERDDKYIAAKKKEEAAILRRRAERKLDYEKRDLLTVGVRFPRMPGTLYTYLVPEGINMYLGMEVVARDSDGCSKCCYIVRVDEEVIMPQTMTAT
jgi:hypothetical protein